MFASGQKNDTQMVKPQRRGEFTCVGGVEWGEGTWQPELTLL